MVNPAKNQRAAGNSAAILAQRLTGIPDALDHDDARLLRQAAFVALEHADDLVDRRCAKQPAVLPDAAAHMARFRTRE